MTKLTLRNITGNDPNELDVKKNYFISNYDANACNLEDALDSVERGQGDLKAFLLAVGTSRRDSEFNQILSEIISDFDDYWRNEHDIIAFRYPYVLPTIVLAVEARMISIHPNTQLFEGYNVFEHISKEEEEVIIAPPLTGPSPKKVQELSERLEKYFEVNIPRGDIHSVLTFLFNKIRIPIEAQPGKPVVLKKRQFLDNLAVHIVGESDEYRCPHLFNHQDDAHYLDPSEWCMSCCARMTEELFAHYGYGQTSHLTGFIPPRDVAHPEVVRDMCNFFKGSEEPTYPDWLKDMLAAAPSGPNEGQTPPQNPTASRSIGISSNSEGTNTAHKLPEVLTDADQFWANMKTLIRSEVNAALRAKTDNKGGVIKSRAKPTPRTQTPNTRRGGGNSVTPAQRAHSGTHRAANVNGGK